MTTERTDLQGNAIPSQLPIINAFSPLPVSQERQPQAQQYDLMMQLKKQEKQKTQSLDLIKKALEKGDTSVLQGLDEKTRKSLEKSMQLQNIKKELNPLEQTLFNMSKDELASMQNDPQYGEAAKKVLNLKNSLSQPKIKTPKISKTLPKPKKWFKKGRAAAKPKLPKFRKVSVAKGPRVRKVKPASFKQASFAKLRPTKSARKTIKIKA